jgi:hypothetical protein
MASSFMLELMPNICENLHVNLLIVTFIWPIVTMYWQRYSHRSDEEALQANTYLLEGAESVGFRQ